ncbi:hypothetical protein BS78_09G210000 [Paspalum vaginatum]|nr:hypothetical protein BS78_09G210000 [Paspalum vaginatum]
MACVVRRRGRLSSEEAMQGQSSMETRCFLVSNYALFHVRLQG